MESENGITERKQKQKRNTEYGIKISMINKNFTLHDSVQSKENFILVFLVGPLNIFFLLYLDRVCRSVGYAPINVNPVGGGGGMRERGENLIPETIPLSGF